MVLVEGGVMFPETVLHNSASSGNFIFYVCSSFVVEAGSRSPNTQSLQSQWP